MKTLVTLLVLAFTNAAFGADPFRVVVVGWAGCQFEPVESGATWMPQGTGIGAVGNIAPAPGGRVFAAMYSGNDGKAVHIEEIRPDESRTVVSETVTGWYPLSLSIDRAGRMYVLANECGLTSGCNGEHAVLTFDAQGNAGTVHPLGTGYSWPTTLASLGVMDLATDQCTILLTRNRTAIRRFNVCTGTFLPDFALANPESNSLRILPDGGLLVGHPNGVDRYTAAGAMIQTYSMSNVGAIALVDGGAKAWIAQRCGLDLIELDVATGVASTIDIVPPDGNHGMVAYGGWTAALGAHLRQSVPTATEAMLALLVVLIALAAFLRLG